GEKISTSTFNKKDNTLKLEIKENGKIIQDSYINLNNDNNIQNYIEPRATRAQESVRCIYSKLRYSINMKSWTITNSKGSVKKRPETVSHKDYLYRFRDAVKASRRSENLAEASMGAAKIAAIYGIVTAATGVGAVVSVVTAAGGSLGAAYNLWDSVIEKREADRYFAIL
ncbi:geobacillin-26 family protein, partial [Paraclostridium sordellii]